MGADPDWPVMLADYKTALRAFDGATAALTAALVDRNSRPDDLSALFTAEASAREAVVLTRMRLMNACRESQPEADLARWLSDQRDKHA